MLINLIAAMCHNNGIGIEGKLPWEIKAELQHFSKDLNSQVVTLGDKNAELQAAKFESSTQPFYFYVDENGNKLADKGYSYNPDVQKFIDHLDSVKANYKRTHS